MTAPEARAPDFPVFDRTFFKSDSTYTKIGDGAVGGKAHGLAIAHEMLQRHFPDGAACAVEINVPRFTVIGTDVFDAFIARNSLQDIAFSDEPDERIAHAFQNADLPVEFVGDLRALIEGVHTPLAVRSSSLLEDALAHPFAGVYETKMTPNNQPDAATRFRKLLEAIKFVYASTFFRQAKNYIRTTDRTTHDEKMAVIIQEVVGRRYDDRFYPELSGVCRSYNFYPVGRVKPEDGVVNLALGLGKAIVDGGVTWVYSPQRPKAPPPFGSVGDLLRNTQTKFWAVNMAGPPAFDPIAEAEYLSHNELGDAEYDGTLKHLASTYNAESDRLNPGVGMPGARALNFAPLLELETHRFNDVVKQLLAACEEDMGADVEIEFAMTFPSPTDPSPPRFGFLQVRPMMVSDEEITIDDSEFSCPEVLLTAPRVMGNGIMDDIRDVVYVKPEPFEAKFTVRIAAELEKINLELLNANRPYLLIGFGRWGSSDSWLGVPVNWGQICGAKVIVEAALPQMNIEPSQGAHFFHNITSFKVSYLTVPDRAQPGIDWSWLDAQPAEHEAEYTRHVHLNEPICVKVDGRTGRGVILRTPDDRP